MAFARNLTKCRNRVQGDHTMGGEVNTEHESIYLIFYMIYIKIFSNMWFDFFL